MKAAALAIDHGTRRTGFATSDPLRIATRPLEVWQGAGDGGELVERVAEIALEREVGTLVVGLPVNMDGSEGPASKNARDFSRQLADAFDLPVHLIDERLTSHEAQNALSETGLSSRKTKPHRDAVAAAAILRDFLQQQASEQGQPGTCP